MKDQALAGVFRSHWRGESAVSVAELEAVLRDIVKRVQGEWPDLSVAPEAFVQYLAERLPTGEALMLLGRLHASDLYLACGCVAGDAEAICAFEGVFLKRLRDSLRGRSPGSVLDDVYDIIREQFLLGSNGVKPKLAGYSGRGALASWLRIAAVRMAVKFRRAHGRREAAEENAAALLGPGADPELDYIRTRYRSAFESAFREALGALPAKERGVLGLHFVDGLSMDRIAAIYAVNRSTVFRWIAKCRERLLVEMRSILVHRIQSTEEELDSLMALFQTQLDVSIIRYLPGAEDSAKS
jgi:RNA polymerase sigma-70 factor (ECF subfamily)